MAGVTEYVPERGHVVWLDFDPQAGHEQAGRRPALVLSPRVFNERTGLFLVCPITNRAPRYQFEVQVPQNVGVTGVILSAHVKSLDWRVRRADYICEMPRQTVAETLGRVSALLR
ncbi:MAG: mRNA interferase MazF [Chloroflexia bacterium]|jgi:mRNA interferase MazF|nr:mRNA interferase MazF [Chloroflexia bacterium]